jgi:hypothetical protein
MVASKSASLPPYTRLLADQGSLRLGAHPPPDLESVFLNLTADDRPGAPNSRQTSVGHSVNAGRKHNAATAATRT